MQSPSHHKAMSLLTNMGTIIAHSIGDGETAKYLSERCGEYRERFVRPSTSGRHELWDVLTGNTGINVSVDEKYEPCLRPGDFSGLRSGGPGNNFAVDAWVIRNEPFKSGYRFLFVTFMQK